MRYPEEELGAIEEQIDTAVEALVTLREAKSQINAIRRDRGFKGSSKGKGKNSGKGRDKGCFACGSDSHWKGDPECPKTSKSASPPKNVPKFPRHMRSSSSTFPSKSSTGQRSEAKVTEVQVAEVNVVDLLSGAQSSDLNVSNLNVTFADRPTIHEINMIASVSLSEALASSNGSAGNRGILEADKFYVAAVDSACNRSCAGGAWIQHILTAIEKAPHYIRDLVKVEESKDLFRFGNE